MSEVYYIRLENRKDVDKVSGAARTLLDKLVDVNNIELAKKMAVKVHFGERGNLTFIGARNYDGVTDYLKEHGVDASYIETTVLYGGPRSNSESHKKLAEQHGFTQLPIVIADGKSGEDHSTIEINKRFYTHCYIGKAFADYQQIVVISHFKGHQIAGFGGALKQLAMGFGSREGKKAQHAATSIKLERRNCTKCGICAKTCPEEAIMMRGMPTINSKSCIGCGKCVALCPNGALYVKSGMTFGGSNLPERIAEYAYAAAQGRTHIYINFALSIAGNCDCMGVPMPLVSKDIGVLASMDPVALDRACLDLLWEKNNKRLFEKGVVALEYGEEIGLGSNDYVLKEI